MGRALDLEATRSALRRLYEEFRSKIPKASIPGEGLTAPLLIAPTEAWCTATRRALYIGQETLGWSWTQPLAEKHNCLPWPFPEVTCLEDFIDGDQAVEALMTGYERFDFAGNWPDNRNSPFWRTFRTFGKMHNATMLWSNLCRVAVIPPHSERTVLSRKSKYAFRNAPAEFRASFAALQGWLLRREVHVLQPDCIVFVTGPSYDEFLHCAFKGADLVSVLDGVPGRQFAQVVASGLPPAAWRTYHPGYLCRSRSRLEWLDRLNF